MFDIKRLFDKKKRKPLIIAIHGFGKRRSDEYLNFIAYFKDYDIVTPVLFDQTKPDDVYWYNWVSRAEECIVKSPLVVTTNDKVEIKYLFLIAPAFEYMTFTTVSSIFKKPTINDLRYVEIPTSFTPVFMDVVNNCKDAIYKITCPVTIFHCIDDATISYMTSVRYYKKISHDNKRLIIYGDGSHHLMDEEKLKDLCFETIRRELDSY
mgnify:CR=1 FL=1